MSILQRLRTLGLELVEAVKDARTPSVPSEPTFMIKTPGTDEVIQLEPPKRFDAPLTPDQAFEEAKRIAMDYAQKRTGNPDLTWKQVKRLMDRWEKEERLVDREREKEIAMAIGESRGKVIQVQR